MTDSKYFTTTKKGEVFELRADLSSDRKDKKKDAVKKVIASMTVGKDVSALFPDVVNCMQTENLELKKLVYLYLMNYAKSQPDMTIMAVNTFVKDCDDPNPLIRALAVRTMGCIRVERITEYLCEPLRKCLKDDDPYVRKTAAVCVAKLHDISSDLVAEQGFLDALKDLLSDSNPMVVANAVAALAEIGRDDFMNRGVVNKLLTALNECTEWGQIFILDSVAEYAPQDAREAQSICERVTPRLSHANAAVVLSTIKVLMRFMELIPDVEFKANLLKKLAPPLVTLLSSEPEVQYVALRNINLIVQKKPEILKHEIKVFFVKYNDPIYVKLEKLDIMIRLASPHNIAQVLAELKEYATEVDVDFVRKAVRAIGRCAIKVENSAERCVQTLIDLIQTKVNYVVQEAIVVIKDIFRKYPNKYESIIAQLCENLDSLDEPEARAAMVWIIGEYAERIDNADELLESFLDGFNDESTQVQLQLLTAIVKLFLKKPNDCQQLVQTVLSLATQDSDNPDLRDRGYIYWRLLSTDPAAAKDVVLAERPLISDETDLIEPTLLDELICHISSLASVYHKPPNSFVDGAKLPIKKLGNTASESGGVGSIGDASLADGAPAAAGPSIIPSQTNLIDDLLGLDLGPSTPQQAAPQAPMSAATAAPTGSVDLLSGGFDQLLDFGGAAPQATPPQAPAAQPMNQNPMGGGLLDLMGGGGTPPAPAPTGLDALGNMGLFGGAAPAEEASNKQIWLDSNQAMGLEIRGEVVLRNGQVTMELDIANKAMSPMSQFGIQFNKNSFGLGSSSQLQIASLPPNQSTKYSLPLTFNNAVQKMEPLDTLQVAIKNNIKVFYFATTIPMEVLFAPDGKMERQVFLATWKDIPQQNESTCVINGIGMIGADAIQAKLETASVFNVAKRNVEGQDMLYNSFKLTNGIWCLLEFRIQPGNGDVTLALKARQPEIFPLINQAMSRILS